MAYLGARRNLRKGPNRPPIRNSSPTPLKRLSFSRYPLRPGSWSFSSIGGSCHEEEESLVPSDVGDFGGVARQLIRCREGGSATNFYCSQSGTLVGCSHLGRQKGAGRRRPCHHRPRHGCCPRCQY